MYITNECIVHDGYITFKVKTTKTKNKTQYKEILKSVLKHIKHVFIKDIYIHV